MVKRVDIVLQHGWAFDSNCWNDWHALTWAAEWDVRLHLLDRGYTGKPEYLSADCLDTDGRLVLVAHSWGLHLIPGTLLERCDAALLIGCFKSLNSSNDRLIARKLERMQKQLHADPAVVVDEFFSQCAKPFERIHHDAQDTSHSVEQFRAAGVARSPVGTLSPAVGTPAPTAATRSRAAAILSHEVATLSPAVATPAPTAATRSRAAAILSHEVGTLSPAAATRSRAAVETVCTGYVQCESDSWDYQLLMQDLRSMSSPDLAAAALTKLRRVKILHGRMDAIVPVSCAYELQETCAGSQLTIIEDAGHDLPFRDANLCENHLSKLLEETNLI